MLKYDKSAIVDDDEYRETMRNINIIATEAKIFVKEYIKYKKGLSELSNSVLRRKYHYSTLKYFHPELGL